MHHLMHGEGTSDCVSDIVTLHRPADHCKNKQVSCHPCAWKTRCPSRKIQVRQVVFGPCTVQCARIISQVTSHPFRWLFVNCQHIPRPVAARFGSFFVMVLSQCAGLISEVDGSVRLSMVSKSKSCGTGTRGKQTRLAARTERNDHGIHTDTARASTRLDSRLA